MSSGCNMYGKQLQDGLSVAQQQVVTQMDVQLVSTGQQYLMQKQTCYCSGVMTLTPSEELHKLHGQALLLSTTKMTAKSDLQWQLVHETRQNGMQDT